MRLVLTFVPIGLVLVFFNDFATAELTEPTFWIDAIKLQAASKTYYWIYLKQVDDQKRVKSEVEKDILMEANDEISVQDIEIDSCTMHFDKFSAVSWLQGLKELNKFLSEKQGLNRRIILCPSYEKFTTMEPFFKKLLSSPFEDYELGLKQFPDVNESEFFEFYEFFKSNEFTLRPIVEIYNWDTVAKNAMVETYKIKPSAYSAQFTNVLFHRLTKNRDGFKYATEFDVIIWIRRDAIIKEEKCFQKVAKYKILISENFNPMNAQERDDV